MSSNQWNLVTKSKKQKNFDKKLEAREEKKRLDAVLPKLEEILPTEQYRNLIAGKNEKSNLSPSKSSSGSSVKNKSPAKKPKPNVANNKEQQNKKQQKPKTNKHKNLESALRSITADDLRIQLDQLKLQFPGSELLWLKGIAAYLNLALPYESDPTFSGKSVNYPSNLAIPAMKATLLQFLNSIGEPTLKYFFHTLLVSMVMELSKNLPIIGYKFLLQIIAQNWPHICTDNMANTALLRNSYQNRPNICLSIFWAIGQGGFQELMSGIKVWQNLMLPNLKIYSKYVTDYIESVLSLAANQSFNLNQIEFFDTYNAIRGGCNGLLREQQQSLERSAGLLLQKYIASSSKHANIFLSLFREIEAEYENRIELEGCLSCLLRNGYDSFRVWKMNYKKQIIPTVLLLHKISEEWEHRAYILVNSIEFEDFLAEAKIFNEELSMAKKRDPNLDGLIAALMKIVEKAGAQKKKQSTDQKKSCSSCKWVLGSIFIIALIGGVLAYDTNVNGKGVFEKSATGKALKNAGLLPHVQKGWYTTMGASARGYKWAEQHVPPYAKPVIKLSCDLFKLARNTACNSYGALRDFLSAKLPLAAKSLDQYVPGLPQKIEDSSVVIKNAACDVFGKAMTFFRTQVLVGRLSPESLSQALNQTQNVALEYFNLFNKKVDAYAKLK